MTKISFSIVVDGNAVSYFFKQDDGTEKHLIDFQIAKAESAGQLYVPIECFYTLKNFIEDGWSLDSFTLEKTEKGD